MQKKVVGKGTVEIDFTPEKMLTLTNVLYVHEIRKKKLVFIDLLCKKGFRVAFESNNVIMSKSGVFVGKGCSSDETYQLSINIKLYLQLILLNLFIYGYRLAHLNFRYLKNMKKLNLINFNGDIAKCEICAKS